MGRERPLRRRLAGRGDLRRGRAAAAPPLNGDRERRLDRARGALVGVHVGDALGASVEFMSWEQVRERHPDGVRDVVGGGPFAWPPGHATDDTDLTRAVVLAHLAPGGDVVHAAADAMLAWYLGDWPGRTLGEPPRDVGGATRQGLLRYQAGGDPRRAGAGPGSAGNGSLMRCLPTALAVGDPGRRRRVAGEISAVTHDDVRCVVACQAYVELVAALVGGEPPEGAVRTALATTDGPDGDPRVAAAIGTGGDLDLTLMAATGDNPLPDGGRGYVLDSLAFAVAAVLDARPLEDVLVDVVRLGGDTDTNGAIAGGLLGAREGLAAVPPRWLSPLQFGEEFLAAAGRLLLRRNRDGGHDVGAVETPS